MSEDLELVFTANDQSLDALFDLDQTLLTDILLFDERIEIDAEFRAVPEQIQADVDFGVDIGLTADFGDVTLGDISIEFLLAAALEAPESAVEGRAFRIGTGDDFTVDTASIQGETLSFSSLDVDLEFDSLGGVIDNIAVFDPAIGRVDLPGIVEFAPFTSGDVTLIDVDGQTVNEIGLNTGNAGVSLINGSDISRQGLDIPSGALGPITLFENTRVISVDRTVLQFQELFPDVAAFSNLTSSAELPLQAQVADIFASADLDFTIAQTAFVFSLEVLQEVRFEPSVVSATFTIEGEKIDAVLGEDFSFTIDDASAPALADGELNGSVEFSLGGRLVVSTTITPDVLIGVSSFSASGELALSQPGRTPSTVALLNELEAGRFTIKDDAPVILLQEVSAPLPEGFFASVTEDFAIDVRDPQPPVFANARTEIEVDEGQRTVLDFGLVEVSDEDTDTEIELQLSASEGRLFADPSGGVTVFENLTELTLTGTADNLTDFLRGGGVEVEIPEGAGNQELRVVASDDDGFDNVPFNPIQLIVNPEEEQVGGQTGGGGDDTLLASDRNQDGETDDPLDLESALSFDGGGGNDRFAGGNGDDFFIGGAGNDTGNGGGGADQLFGGDNDDSLFGADGFDDLFGGRGSDTLFGGDDIDLLFGGDNDDLIEGDDAGDRLFGGEGDDTIFGGDGPDFANGGAGNDRIEAEAAIGGLGDDNITADSASGGDGNDTLSGRDLSGNDGNDRIIATERAVGGDGADRIDARGLAFGGDGSDTITATGGGRFEGGEGADEIRAVGVDASLEIFGGDGADTLSGGRAADRIFGGDGVDELSGGEGNDSLEGGDDGDFLDGGFGVDTLFGGEGNDTLRVGGVGVANAVNELFGEGGDDDLRGGSDVDHLFGGIGRDTLEGRGGNDLLLDIQNVSELDGGEGDDTLIAGEFDDTLIGGLGDDSLIAGGGDDFINLGLSIASLVDEENIVEANEGDDLIATFGSRDRVDAGENDDRIVIRNNFAEIDGGDGFDIAFIGEDLIANPDPNVNDLGEDFFQNSISVAVDLNQGVIETLQGTDTFTLDISNLINVERIVFSHEVLRAQTFTQADGTTIQTQIERDIFIGDDEDNDFQFAKSGFHTLLGGAGNDTLQAAGASTFDGEAGADLLIGGEGGDLFIADFEDQFVEGNGGLDTLSFENISAEGGLLVDLAESVAAQANVELGFASIENLIGRTDGDDTLFGGIRADTRVEGRGGDDTLGVASVERTRIEGGDGLDTLVFVTDQRVEVNAFENNAENDGAFFLPDFFNSSFGTFQSVENFVGTDFDGTGDLINGTSISNLINGVGGDDTLNGQDGNDTLLGGAGSDSLSGGEGVDLLDGGDGNDILVGGGDGDTYRFGENFGQDEILGFVEDVDQIDILADPEDIVFRNVGADTLITINGTTDQITVRGVSLAREDIRIIIPAVPPDEPGNTPPVATDDEATVAAGGSVDIAVLDNDVDADGDQLILLSADDPENGRVEIIEGEIRYTPDADFVGTDSFLYRITDGNGGVDAGSVAVLVEAAESSVNENDDLLQGDGGANILAGGVGADTLLGAGGADTLNGGAGADSLSGGAGQDVISGGGGGDVILGGGGADSLSGNGGRDEIMGGGGRDTIAGGGGADQLSGNGGRDEISGGGGRDEIFGGGGADVLSGDGGRDVLSGDGGRDSLSGGAGADALNGGNGRDELTGGRGDDVLTGGAGADRFIFNTGDRRDVITDFQQGVDRIVLESGADAFDDLKFAQLGDDVRITFANVAVTLEGQEVAQFSGNDFIFL